MWRCEGEGEGVPRPICCVTSRINVAMSPEVSALVYGYGCMCIVRVSE